MGYWILYFDFATGTHNFSLT